jgi:hypothetical protein
MAVVAHKSSVNIAFTGSKGRLRHTSPDAPGSHVPVQLASDYKNWIESERKRELIYLSFI